MENPTNKYWIDFLIDQETDITTAPVFPKYLAASLFIGGEFDGCSVALQVSPDDVMNTDLYPTPSDARWFAKTEATFTDEEYINCDLSEAWHRIVLTGAGLNTSVSVKMRPRNSAVIAL